MRTTAKWSLLLFFIAWIVGCSGTKEEAQNWNVPLTGQPSWIPLGAKFSVCNPNTTPVENTIVAEVYHSGDRLKVEKERLSFVPEPRWFQNLPKLISREEYVKEYVAQRKENERQSGWTIYPGPEEELKKELKEGETNIWIRQSLQYPEVIEDLPLSDQGASLSLEIMPGKSRRTLHFVLELKAGERPLWREVEHRHTNILPFLFAIYSDEKAVVVKEPQDPFWAVHEGGIKAITPLVAAGGTKRWDLTVDAKSLNKIVQERSFRNIAVVAVFSERQHQGGGQWRGMITRASGDERLVNQYEQYKGPQVLVRSNTVRLASRRGRWVVVNQQ